MGILSNFKYQKTIDIPVNHIKIKPKKRHEETFIFLDDRYLLLFSIR